MIWSVIVIDVIVLLLDIREGGWAFDARTNVTIGLLIEQFLLLAMLRMGYVKASAMIVLISLWGAMTYGAWNAGGVHDLAIFVY